MIRTHVERSAIIATMYLSVMKPRNVFGVPYSGPNTQLGTSRERNTEGTTYHHGTNFFLLKPVPSSSNPSFDFSTFYLEQYLDLESWNMQAYGLGPAGRA